MSNIFIIILSTLTVSFAIAYSVTLYRIAKINQAFAKLFLSHESLQEFIAKNNVEFKNDSDIHKENFIKFLSDSRDWAFAYIEDVQQALNKFITEVEPEIVYFEKYGAILSEQRPDYISLKKISEAFKELKSVMPVEPVEKDA
jgi:Tfp pilus assembly protein PilE